MKYSNTFLSLLLSAVISTIYCDELQNSDEFAPSIPNFDDLGADDSKTKLILARALIDNDEADEELAPWVVVRKGNERSSLKNGDQDSAESGRRSYRSEILQEKAQGIWQPWTGLARESDEDENSIVFLEAHGADDADAETVGKGQIAQGDFGPTAQGQTWAVLVAGSSGIENYRHQADICHAYHTLINHGVHRDHIITMMVDDIAQNPENKHKGKIFNNPRGQDVYAGVRIDYSGRDVTPENFVAVLLGDEDGVSGGNGRVLKSTSNDKVFVNFVDHGGVGVISFPENVLTVKTLRETLAEMHSKRMYKELMFYLEACESGSMFDYNPRPHLEIYAVTAANSSESSWGCFCDTELFPEVCLGDLFSVNWMFDSDKEDIRAETLEHQFELVRRETNESHVSQFGNRKIAGERVSEFQGSSPVDSQLAPGRRAKSNPETPRKHARYPARDIPLVLLKKSYEREERPWVRHRIAHKIHKIISKRKHLERDVARIVKTLVPDPEVRHRVLTQHPASGWAGGPAQMDCHHGAIHNFHEHCYNMGTSPYALKYAFVFANLCEMDIGQERIETAIAEGCRNMYYAVRYGHQSNVV